MGLHLRTVQDIHLQAPTKSAAKLILKRFIFMVLFLCLLLLAIIRFFSLFFVRFFHFLRNRFLFVFAVCMQSCHKFETVVRLTFKFRNLRFET